MRLRSLGAPLVIAIAMLTVTIAWCIAGSSYVDHVRVDNGARNWAVDQAILTLGEINRMDRLGWPIAQMIYSTWWPRDSSAGPVAFGLLVGTGIGALGGVYFFGWGVARGCQTFMHREPIERTLNWVTRFYLVASLIAIILACWSIVEFTHSSTDLYAMRIILLSGVLGVAGSSFVFGLFAWVGYWCVIAGQRLVPPSLRF
jgi:hypothetical protein